MEHASFYTKRYFQTASDSQGAFTDALARLVFSRKIVSLGLIFCFIGLVTYNHTSENPYIKISLNGGETGETGEACPSNRTNPNRVAIPSAQDTEFLSGLWKELHDLFLNNVPSPAHIEQPKHDGFPDQKDLGSFFSLTEEEANSTRATNEIVIAELPEYPEGRFNGRGVVMLAGGRYSEFAATSVGMLREVGSKLPVEIWAKDESEEFDGWCDEILSEGMVCRRLADYMDLESLKNPYQWKVFTLLFSTFSDIIFLDADDMPIRNPDFIFDSDVYKDNGVILWPDYWMHTGSPWLPYLIGLTSDKQSDMLLKEKSVESGQIVWNKQTHWKVRLNPEVTHGCIC